MGGRLRRVDSAGSLAGNEFQGLTANGLVAHEADY